MCCFLGVFLTLPTPCAFPPQNPPSTLLHHFSAAEDFVHHAGEPSADGWELDYDKTRPGYALTHLKNPLLLEPGTYRTSFIVRRGHYPKKGLLHNTYGVFRLELWDETTNEKLNERELQMGDFTRPNHLEKRWLDFSMEGRRGHLIEPRVYWLGLANAEVKSVDIERFPDVSLKALEDKALSIGEKLARHHLENGFVVARRANGSPEDTGDATTYTGYYLASLAWKVSVKKDPLTYQALENAVKTLHTALKGTDENPLLTRFVEKDGTPHPKGPSKDVYSSFFFGYAVAYPFVENAALKKQMREDADKVATRLLKDRLTVQGTDGPIFTLAPYFTEGEVRLGLKRLFADKHDYKNLLRQIRQAHKYLPFGELWPGQKKVVKALKKQDEDALLQLVVPTLNGLAQLGERVRDVLREQYRTDLFPKRFRNQNYPGKQLESALTEALHKFPEQKNDRRFNQLSDLKILAANALIALHIIRTAQWMTDDILFDDYYKTNLYTQEALLQTALDWYAQEETIIQLTAGNPAADQARKGIVSTLALYNLIRLEKNPAVKETYRSILDRWWESNRNEDNPLAAAIYTVCSGKGVKSRHATFVENVACRDLTPFPFPDAGVLLRALDLYPENRTGYGKDYWKVYGTNVANAWGGGSFKGFSREPLPLSHRPKDNFLWQRNPRRLSGDDAIDYPGTDYLFVYWFCRHHGLIPPTPPEPTAKKK
ncbi:MAG: hypothetical protein LHV69_07345 [Elusimicrobia bacterium]|nr:hypothetical protein [Candidatus Obscuribacterium magneticum]